jgi:hypothetical protein
MMPLDEAGETSSLAGADDVNQFLSPENVSHHFVARVRTILSLDLHFANESGWRGVRLLEVTRHGLVDASRFYELDETELNGVIAIFLRSLFLHYHAGSRLNDGDRNDAAVILQQLGHADLFS